MYSYGPLHMAKQNQNYQLEHTYSSYMRIRDVALKTCQKRWMIERNGERGSEIFVLAARQDDDDIYIYIYIYIRQVKTGGTFLSFFYSVFSQAFFASFLISGSNWLSSFCFRSYRLIIFGEIDCSYCVFFYSLGAIFVFWKGLLLVGML